MRRGGAPTAKGARCPRLLPQCFLQGSLQCGGPPTRRTLRGLLLERAAVRMSFSIGDVCSIRCHFQCCRRKDDPIRPCLPCEAIYRTANRGCKACSWKMPCFISAGTPSKCISSQERRIGHFDCRIFAGTWQKHLVKFCEWHFARSGREHWLAADCQKEDSKVPVAFCCRVVI